MENVNTEIFKSKLSLMFINPEIQRQFDEETNRTIMSHNIPYICAALISIIGVCIYESLSYQLYQGQPTYGILITSYTTAGIYFFALLVSIIWRKKLIVQRIVNYLNFYLIIFIFGTLRNHLINILKLDCVIYTMTIVMEFLLRIGYLFLGSLNFVDSSCIIILNVVSYWAFWPGFLDLSLFYSRILIFDFLWIFESVIFYFYHLHSKKSFFYQKSAEQKCQWYKNIFENMNTGFFHIKNRQISYLNNALVKLVQSDRHLVDNLINRLAMKSFSEQDKINSQKYANSNQEKRSDVDKLITLTNNAKQISEMLTTDKLVKHSEILVEFFLEGLDTEYLNKCRTSNNDLLIRNANGQNESMSQKELINEFFDTFKSEAIRNNQRNDFIQVGTKVFEIQKVDSDDIVRVVYDVYCRFYVDSTNTNEEFEFLFNDVTKTEVLMEKKADTKYKALFLSKIAHEFKNPLISIGEVADQITELLDTTDKKDSTKESSQKAGQTRNAQNYPISSEKNYMLSEIKKCVPIIRGLSYYLIMLIKDLDHFSNKSSGQELIEVNIKDITNYCCEIANSLLANMGKAKDVKFTSKLSHDLPKKLQVDETKVKQILVNLMSNAIRYTNKGTINLEVYTEERSIRFKVTDSGQGIPFKKQNTLFIPVIKGYNNQNQSSGLGLTIVKELCSLIGSKIEFSSKINEGSSFWFDVFAPQLSKLSTESINEITGSSKDINNSYIAKLCREKPQPKASKSMFNVVEQKINRCKSLETGEVHHEISYHSNNIVYDLPHEIHDSSADTFKVDKLTIENPYSQNKKQNVNYNQIKYYFNHNIVINPPSSSSSEDPVTNSEKIHYFNNNCPTLLVVDDDAITRQSAIRMVKKAATDKNMKINLLEAEDGIECLYIVYRYLSKGLRINGIICDETMNYMKGSTCAQIIRKLLVSKSLETIPFFTVTAYEDDTTLRVLKNDCIDEIFSKPLSKPISEKILSNLLM